MKINNKTYPILLIIIAVASHIIWFSPGATLFHGDWLHWSDDAAQQAWRVLGAWNNFMEFGTPRTQIGFSLIQNLWSFITGLGGSYDAAVKITLLVPIAILGFLAPYIAVLKIVSDRFIAFIAALFYGSTTYFLLRERSHLQIAFVYAFAPIIFVLFIKAFERARTRDWLLFALAYTLGLCYEVRIMYIFTFVLVLYALLFFPVRQIIKKFSKQLLLTVLVILFLNSFWLLPTLLGGVGSTIAGITSRTLFGNNLFDLSHAITLSVSSWTGSMPNEDFIMQPILPYLWLVPLVILSPLILRTKQSNSRRAYLLFFLITALAGIFLTKQAHDPLPQAYPWLYYNFPGFSLFREASKFYLLISFGYLGLLSIGLISLKNLKKKVFYVSCTVIAGIGFINLLPLVSGSIGGLSVSRDIPHDYALLNSYVASQPEFSRTLWLPANSQWAYFNDKHPRISAIVAAQQDWKDLLKNTTSPIDLKLASLLNNPLSSRLLGVGSVKYLVVPLRDQANSDDFVRYYGNDPQFYTDMLDNIPWLEQLDIGMDEAAVYKNKSYQPQFTVLDKIVGYKNLNDLGDKYQFAAQNKLGLDFIEANDNLRSQTLVEDLFDQEPLQQKNIGREQDKKYTLYANLSAFLLAYTVQNNILIITQKKPPVPDINGVVLPTQETPKPIQFDMSDGDYFLSIGDEMLQINHKEREERNLGLIRGSISLFKADNTNLIQNPNFEERLWKDNVEDCNAYDDKGLIWMEHSSDALTTGGKSVKLEAALHTACTGPDSIAVSPGEYIFGFDYKGQNSKEAGYTVEFNDAKKTRINKRFEIMNNKWKTYLAKITVPQGASSLTLKVNAYDQISDIATSPKAAMYYTNLRLSPLLLVSATDINNPKYEKVNLDSAKEIRASVQSNDYPMTNELSNNSFENGLWKDKVGDCHAYDDNPQIGMRLSSNAPDGKNSLQLEAKRHIACTSSDHIKVKENLQYNLSFDYQSPNSGQAGYFISFDDPAGTVFKERLPIKDNHWNKFSKTIKTPYGATEATLVIYAYPDNQGIETMINRYDNFSLIEIPDMANRFFIVSTPVRELVKPGNVEFDLINPTQKAVHIKDATTPFFLTMSDAFHDRWKLEINNSNANGFVNSWVPWANPDLVPAADHFKLDNFLNGWYVDVDKLCKEQNLCKKNTDGSYDIELIAEFTPQRWFYTGSLISTTTFIGTVGYLGYDWRKKRASRVVYRAKYEI